MKRLSKNLQIVFKGNTASVNGVVVAYFGKIYPGTDLPWVVTMQNIKPPVAKHFANEVAAKECIRLEVLEFVTNSFFETHTDFIPDKKVIDAIVYDEIDTNKLSVSSPILEHVL